MAAAASPSCEFAPRHAAELDDVLKLVRCSRSAWQIASQRLQIDSQDLHWTLRRSKATSLEEQKLFPLPSDPLTLQPLLSIADNLNSATISDDEREAVQHALDEGFEVVCITQGELNAKWEYQVEISFSSEEPSITLNHGPTYDERHGISNLFKTFESTLRVILRDENCRLEDLLSITEEERDQIWRWNATVPPRISKSPYQYFREHAMNQPGEPAIHSWDGSLTYGELQQLVKVLAHRLNQLGVREGSIVPLCFEKSMWTVVALLAVMKTGACFTLMDPSQPTARLRSIVEQTEAQALLASVNNLKLARELSDSANIVPVGKEIVASQDLPNFYQDDEVEINCEAPMYLQFTSGSTGQPKGVVVSFSSYTSGMIPRAEKVGYHAGSRCLDFPSYAFDVSIDCILCTLSAGGCVCVPSEDDRINDIGGAIKALKANMVHVTPSVARLLDPDVLDAIEVLGLGGEYVSPDDIKVWSSTCKLAIAYGPSECTVGCTINDQVSEHCPGIGRGVGGITWIVDPENSETLSPLGAIGELLIEGPIVGDGYLGQPEKTAEVFIDSPSWLSTGYGSVSGRQSRLYKTGDLVRYDTETGFINFIGRKDQQVKLRGQRVELGDVEHSLKLCLPSTLTAVADVVKLGGQGQPTLIAYLAHTDRLTTAHTKDGHLEVLPSSQEIQAILSDVEKRMAQLVPRYMVPTSWLLLNHIPMLVSAKIDRKQLRAFATSISSSQLRQLKSKVDERTAKVDGTESKLLTAWKKVLGHDDITREDNFFRLGGDSLRAMHLVAKSREVGLSLSIADVFTHPVLCEMALVAKPFSEIAVGEIRPFSLLRGTSIDAIRESIARDCDVPSQAIEDVFPCSPLQEGIMALSAKFADAYVAQRVVAMPGLQSATALRSAFDLAAVEASILRTRIVQVPHVGLVQVLISPYYSTETRRHKDLASYLTTDQEEHMGLGTPLVRYGIVDDGNSGIKFVFTIHHALYDGWCMPLIIERVNNAYHGRASTKSTPYKSFINFLTKLDQQECNHFWSNHLKSAALNQFPSLPSSRYQTRANALLERDVKFHGIPSDFTVPTMIRAAWALAASTQTSCDDIVFGETLTGRNAALAGAEQIEGPMITTVPLRVRIDRGLKKSQYIHMVHDLAIERIPYEHAGLQNIRKLSVDAREACELRTGLVLHPKVDEGAITRSSGIADAFIPANETEAAREALNFNTYALMLVFTVHADGFLIMASFDSNCVNAERMAQVLEQFENIFRQVCVVDEQKLSDLVYLDFDSTSKVPEELPPKHKLQSSDSDTSGSPMLSSSSDEHHSDAAMDLSVSSLESNAAPTKATSPKVDIVSRVWCRVLGVEPSVIDSESDFFDFGDSISAMKLVSEARSEGLKMTVAQIFRQRTLEKIASVAEWLDKPKDAIQPGAVSYDKFAALDKATISMLLTDGVKSHLSDPSWTLEDVYPARPLQSIAVDGTVKLPRFSVRYEHIYFEHHLDQARLRHSVQALVDRNEVLRTVFIKIQQRTFGVVLSSMNVECTTHLIEGDLKGYVQAFCAVDVQRVQPLGSPFAAFHYVEGSGGRSCLVFKISHAQYDEVCLPNMLHELSAIYENRPLPASGAPFSTFVKHVVQRNISQSIPYWRNLLRGSQMTSLKPDIPLLSRKAVSLYRTFDISSRPKGVTIATLPTAAWALCLARHLNLRDIVFGEVVSGRNTDLPNSDSIIGPCWQYVPVRVMFCAGLKGRELLDIAQSQHIASSAYEGIGLEEIRRECTNWPESVDWFGSVVHQDVEHVTALPFKSSSCEMETYYPHLENLREVKCQCFVSGQKMTIEIVTFESWEVYGSELLDTFGKALEDLLGKSNDAVLP